MRFSLTPSNGKCEEMGSVTRVVGVRSIEYIMARRGPWEPNPAAVARLDPTTPSTTPLTLRPLSMEKPSFHKFEVRLSTDGSGDPYEGVLHHGWNDATRVTRTLNRWELGDLIGRMPYGSSIFVVSAALSKENQMSTQRVVSAEDEVLRLVDENLPVIFSLNGTRADVEQLIGALRVKARVD
jgi:hypothetical protein